MKFTTIYLEENKIEIFNSILGQETIKVNGETVSQKYSITGAEHVFLITENGILANCRIKMGFGLNGVVFDFYKNNKPLVESPKNDFWKLFIGLLIFGALIGLVIGILSK